MRSRRAPSTRQQDFAELGTIVDRDQLQLLGLIAQGLDNGEIGSILGVRAQTIATRLTKLYQILGARNRAHAIGRGLLYLFFQDQIFATQTQDHGDEQPVSAYYLDTRALYRLLDEKRQTQGGRSWRSLATEIGCTGGAFTRLRNDHAPSADSLLSMLMWLGLADSLSKLNLLNPGVAKPGTFGRPPRVPSKEQL